MPPGEGARPRVRWLASLALVGWLNAVAPSGADPPARPPSIDAQQRARELQVELADNGFQVVVESPFVVVGPESPDPLTRRARGTVRWASERLRAQYFPKLPDHPIEVWLLDGDAAYQRLALERFGLRPSTPFGLYSDRHRAVIVNIRTGSGTVVHEMVHPLMAANFPSCPAWFNEGLASLYEQCEDRDGKIWGLPNWRLRRLQQSMRAGGPVSLAELLALSDAEFYAEPAGLNYARARYLCLYLQERGALPEFYARFREEHPQDPTGAATLCHVLQVENLAQLQATWEAAILALREPVR